MDYHEFRAMNTDVVLAAEGETAQVQQGFAQAVEFVQSMEARLTRFSDESELAQLNASSGNWFHASKELFDLVREARGFFDQTIGLFDPAILDALENVGYDKSMDEIRANGAVAAPAVPVKYARRDFGDVQFDPAARAVRLPPGMRLDLGGIAKGWIAERAAQRLALFARACAVNAGGDLFVIGHPADSDSWSIALEDPRAEDQTLAMLRIEHGAVATSSVSRRRWQQGENVRHHVIDPRTGLPAETDWLCVTVLAPHAAMAEAFAKALLIAGSREAERIAAWRDEIAFVAVDAAGKLWGSKNAKGFLHNGSKQS